MTKIEEYRKAYFALLDSAVKQSGNSKKYLHDYFKMETFPFLFEDPLNFNEQSREVDVPTFSTKSLSEAGWLNFLNEFKHFILDKFNI